jgi:iron complex outermembrane receptor protein
MLNSGIDNVRDKFINVATQTNKGWDVAAVWRTPLYGGELTVDTQHTFQDEAITALFEDTVRDENGQFGEPEWVGRLWLTYDRGAWSYFYGANFVGDVSNYESFGGDTATLRGDTVRVVLDADAVTYHSASVTRYFDDMGLEIVLGVTNATDEQPPRITTLGLGELHTQQAFTAYTQYDIFGRTYFLNLSMDFDK